MKPRLPLLLLATVLVIGLFLLGYLWPVSKIDLAESAADQWVWNASEAALVAHPLPKNLASYWPSKKPLSSAGHNAAAPAGADARHDWMLIGVIRQGGPPSAVVLDPEGKLLTLRVGDRLDEQRLVTALKSTSLIWRDAQGVTGELQLYPEPSAP